MNSKPYFLHHHFAKSQLSIFPCVQPAQEKREVEVRLKRTEKGVQRKNELLSLDKWWLWLSVVSCGCFFLVVSDILAGTVKANALAANFAKIDSVFLFFPRLILPPEEEEFSEALGVLKSSAKCVLARVLRANLAKQTSFADIACAQTPNKRGFASAMKIAQQSIVAGWFACLNTSILLNEPWRG